MRCRKGLAIVGGALTLVALLPAQAIAASDPIKNALTTVGDWVLYGLGIAGVVLLLMAYKTRKFGELAGGVVLLMVAFSVIAAPETWQTAGKNLVATLFK